MESRLKRLEQILRNDRFARHNDIRLLSIGKGEACAEMEIAENHLNGVDIVQGGALFTLADVGSTAALAAGLCWSLAFGALAGALIALAFNALAFLGR